jgi:hypothetical protein
MPEPTSRCATTLRCAPLAHAFARLLAHGRATARACNWHDLQRVRLRIPSANANEASLHCCNDMPPEPVDTRLTRLRK